MEGRIFFEIENNSVFLIRAINGFFRMQKERCVCVKCVTMEIAGKKLQLFSIFSNGCIIYKGTRRIQFVEVCRAQALDFLAD